MNIEDIGFYLYMQEQEQQKKEKEEATANDRYSKSKEHLDTERGRAGR